MKTTGQMRSKCLRMGTKIGDGTMHFLLLANHQTVFAEKIPAVSKKS